MMKNIIFTFLFIMIALCSFCYAEEAVSSAELINNAGQYDGKEVIYKGEVIGDVMMRGESAWVNVSDGANAIGIWVDKNLAKDIVYTGSYRYKGDIVEARGVFHRACVEHGGDLDIHAGSLRKVGNGMVIDKTTDTAKKKAAFILLGLTGLIMILSRLKKIRRLG